MIRFMMLHILALCSFAFLVSANTDVCVNMKVENKCKACELIAGVNVVSWANGVNKCNSREECCARDTRPIFEFAQKAVINCQRNCNRICENQGKSGNLYSATWPRLCLQSCKIMRLALFHGVFGAQCPSDDEPCLKDNFTLDFSRKDVPEVDECRKDAQSCSECLISKTLPNYESKIASCQSTCGDMKGKKFGAQRLSRKATCSVHLYGQYIKFIQDSCTDQEKQDCTPDGGALAFGSCKSGVDCHLEREKCHAEAAALVRDAAKLVATKWRTSCEETCENASDDAIRECIAKGEARMEEVESELLKQICSYLDVRS